MVCNVCKQLQCALMGVALLLSIFMGYYYALPACVLCVLGRVMLGTLFILCAVQLMWSMESVYYRLLEWLGVIFLSLGIWIGGHHLWIQAHPSLHNDCFPPLAYLLKHGLWQMLYDSLSAGQGCQTMDGYWMGLSLPMWLMAVYVLMAILYVVNGWFIHGHDDESNHL